jgi:hypothetical protein
MRQPTLASISWELSVLMAKLWAVYQAATPAKSRQAVITAQGQRQQNATIRSTTVMAGLEHFWPGLESR